MISSRVLTINASGNREKPPPIRVEFSVTAVFRVRIVDPLDAATAEKWQGRPHLAFANGVGRVQQFWNLPKASVRTFLGAAVSDDRVHLQTIAVLQVWVPLLPFSPAGYGDLFHKRCSWQCTRALAIRQFLQPCKRTDGQYVLLIEKRR